MNTVVPTKTIKRIKQKDIAKKIQCKKQNVTTEDFFS